MVKLLIDNGAQIAASDSQGRTPFMMACHAVSDETADYIIRSLSDSELGVLTQPTHSGKTPLRKAAARGHLRIVQSLFERLGSNPAILDERDTKYRQTALHAAARNGHKEVVEYLLKHSANVSIQDKNGYTAFIACIDGWTSATSAGHESVSCLLLEADTQSSSREGVLHGAAMKGSLPVIKKLLEQGADPLRQDRHGWTAIQVARQYDRHEATALLLAHNTANGLRPSVFRNLFPKRLRIEGSTARLIQGDSQLRETGSGTVANHPIPPGSLGFYYELEVLPYFAVKQRPFW
jgi:ankyrin repeat protein